MGKIAGRSHRGAAKRKVSAHVAWAVMGLLATLLVWRRPFFSGQIPFHVDTLCFYFPNWAIGKYLFLEGAHLLWDPFRNMGQPFLAVPQAQALYPLRLFSFGLDYLNYTRIFILFHVLLAGSGAYLWVFKKTKNSVSAGLAGMAVGFTGPFYMRVVFAADFATMAWMPLLLWALNEKKWNWVAVGLALQWMAGYPPLFLLSGLFLLTFLAVDSPGPGSIRNFSIAILIAMGLSAIQWLPFLEMMKLSHRNLILDSELALANSVYLKTLLRGLFLPGSFHEVWSQGNFYRATFYFGPFLMGLATLAAFRGKKRERILFGLMLMFFILSMGSHLVGYEKFPPFRLFRYPGNWIFLGCMMGTFLAAMGLSYIKNKRLAVGIAGVVIFDVLAFATPLHHPVGDETFVTTPAAYEPIAQLPSDERIFHVSKIMQTYETWDWESGKIWPLLKKISLPSYGTAFGVREVFSHHNLTSKRAMKFQQRLNFDPEAARLFQEAAVGAIVQMHGKPPSDSSLAEFDVFKSAFKLDRVFILGGEGSVGALNDRPGGADIDVVGPGRLVFNEAYYPGWKVFVNGERQRVLSHEDVFLAVDLPPGPAHVVFDYDPISFKIGLLLSVGTVFLMIFGQIWASSKKTKRRPTSSFLSR